ncbi:hypothetical protein C7E18_21925, partial [Stenotrophomonas maltophilia]
NDLGEVTTASGAKVRIIDDYGHHPSELEAVFAACRAGTTYSTRLAAGRGGLAAGRGTGRHRARAGRLRRCRSPLQ